MTETRPAVNAPSQQPMDSRGRALQLLREANELGAVCSGYWTDVARCVEQGEQLAYAVDTDVVKLYTSPELRALYGTIFTGSSEPAKQAAALLLGDYIVRRMPAHISAGDPAKTDRSPGLILLSPHDAELQRVGLAISEEALAAGGKIQPQRTEVNSQEIAELQDLWVDAKAEKPGAAERVVKWLTQHHLIHSQQHQTGPELQNSRLTALPPGRFCSLRNHFWFQGDDAQHMPPRRPAHNDSEALRMQFRQLEIRADAWYQRLLNAFAAHMQRSPSTHKAANIASDAWALARLEWVNQRFAAETGPGRRLVLITGAPTIRNAAKGVDAFHAGFADFANAYLRHPKAFLGAKWLAGLGKPGARELADDKLRIKRTELHMADWLSVLLPDNVFQSRFENPGSGELAASTVKIGFASASESDLEAIWTDGGNKPARRRALETFPDKGLRVLDEWLLRAAQRVDNDAAQSRNDARTRLVARLLGSDGTPASAAHGLNFLLRSLELTSIDQLYALTDVVGAVQLLGRNEKIKGLPALRFDSKFPLATKECVALCLMLFSTDRDTEVNLVAMEERLKAEDASGYHARVLKAYVFAAAGLWFQVRPLCLAALLAVDAIPNKAEDDQRTGREAAYLMAVAERRLANSLEGIGHARTALKDAERRDHASKEGGRDLRFVSEALAQEVTEIQLEFFSDASKVGSIQWLPLIGRALASAEFASTVAANTEPALNGPSTIKRWVVRQSVTNGLLLCLMAHDRQVQKKQVTWKARQLLPLLKQRQAPNLRKAVDGQLPYADAVSDFVWLVATAVFAETSDANLAREKLQAELALEHVSKLKAREAGVEAAVRSPNIYVERIRRQRMLVWAGVDVSLGKSTTSVHALNPLK